MATTLARLMEIHLDCGCEQVDPDTVKVHGVCFSANPETSNLDMWNEQFDLVEITASPGLDYADIEEVDNPYMAEVGGIVHPTKTKVYNRNGCQAAIYEDGTDAYLAYSQNFGDGDMDLFFKKLYSKLMAEGKTVFYLKPLTWTSEAINTMEEGWSTEVKLTAELYKL
jgi:hypothetical protein